MDVDSEKFYYDHIIDEALLSFHANDSIGKYIGMVPYGTAAENLAYLGVDIAIGGLPSSTYNGYDTDVDVLFILAETNEDITGTASQVAARYEAGNLTYTDKDGEVKATAFLNTGNIYKAIAEMYTDMEDTEAAAVWTEKFNTWLTENHEGATDINKQGIAQ